MDHTDTVIAVFPTHEAADAAVRTLAAEHFPIKNLSVVGRGYHTEATATGFYNLGDRVRFWGVRGAFWGGLWGMFFGGLFLTVPGVGSVVALGYLAAAAISTLEGAVTVGGLSALGAAFASLGMKKDSVVRYEADLKADSFLVMAHGTAAQMVQAKAILALAGVSRLDEHRADTAATTGLLALAS